MTMQDAFPCRRALRDIREIAAVPGLDDAQTSDRDPLQTILAIAGRRAGETGRAPPEYGNVIRTLEAMIGRADIESVDDRTARDLFPNITVGLHDHPATNAPGRAA